MWPFVHEESILGLVYSCMFSTLLDFMCFFSESHFTFMTFCSISQRPPSCIKNPWILFATTFPLFKLPCFPLKISRKPLETSPKKRRCPSRTTLPLHAPWCPCDFSIVSVCSSRRRRILMSLGQHAGEFCRRGWVATTGNPSGFV